MIDRIAHARGALTLLAVAAALPAPVLAQRQVQPPRIMVTAFHAAKEEKTLGCQAATAVREKLADDNPQRILFVIPRDDIKNALEQSGYPDCEPLASNDAKALANFARADEYIEGFVSKTATGFKLDSRLFLARDNTYSQPIASVEGARLNDIAGKFSRALDDVRRQLEDEKECYTNYRLDKTKEAMEKARSGIRRFPKAVLARVCLLQAMERGKMPKDSMFSVAQEILQIDSSSRPALQITTSWWREKGDTTRWVDALVKLVAADPTNPRLVNDVITQLGQLRKFPVAVPIIKHALTEQPGDVQLLSLAFRVFWGADAYKDFLAVGDEIARIDTSLMDSTYFNRMAIAYQADSQPAKVGETFAKAAAKFPNNTFWLLSTAQMQRQAGQVQQSLETLKKVLAVNPATKGVYLQLARGYVETNMNDSAIAALKAGAAAKDSVPLLGTFALQQANAWYKKGQASKSRDEYGQAIRWAALSDTLSADARAALLQAASATMVAVSALQEAGPAKSCDLAKVASDNFVTVSLIVPKAFSANKEQAGQLMQLATQYGPAADKLKTQLCK